jgi:hypothetical protein
MFQKAHRILPDLLLKEHIMKSVSLAAFTMVLGLAISGTAFAQGRHDEKPHGRMKNPPAASTDTDRVYAGGGRHDEKPHGMKKPAVKQDSTQAVDEKSRK